MSRTRFGHWIWIALVTLGTVRHQQAVACEDTNLSWNNGPKVVTTGLGNQVWATDGHLSGRFCFQWGLAFQCSRSTIETGTEQSFEASFEAGGFSAKGSKTFKTSQSFECDATNNKKCKFVVCYENSSLQHWEGEVFFGFWSYKTNADNFYPGDNGTLYCCCEQVSCTLQIPSEHMKDPVAWASHPIRPISDSFTSDTPAMYVDLATYFDIASGTPPPGHPVTNPNRSVSGLNDWQRCEIYKAVVKAESLTAGTKRLPIQELVIADAPEFGGAVHHYDLTVNPNPLACSLVGVEDVPIGKRLALGVRGNPLVSGAPVRIDYSVPTGGMAKLRIVDVAGKLVTTLVDGDVAAGAHVATWNGRTEGNRRVPAGIYFIWLDVASSRRTASLVVIP